MLTPSRGASAETPRRHRASRGHSKLTPRQMSGVKKVDGLGGAGVNDILVNHLPA